MSHNTRTQNSGQDTDPRRNNPPQYNLRPLYSQVEEQEGDELPLVVERRVARCQPYREMRTERLELCLNTLTELVSTLVAALGQNAANVALTIPPAIPLANMEGGDATTCEAQTESSQHRWCTRCKCQNIA